MISAITGNKKRRFLDVNVNGNDNGSDNDNGKLIISPRKGDYLFTNKFNPYKITFILFSKNFNG